MAMVITIIMHHSMEDGGDNGDSYTIVGGCGGNEVYVGGCADRAHSHHCDREGNSDNYDKD